MTSQILSKQELQRLFVSCICKGFNASGLHVLYYTYMYMYNIISEPCCINNVQYQHFSIVKIIN